MRKIYYQLALAFVSALITTIFMGCTSSPLASSTPRRPVKKDAQVVGGCEYYFDRHGVSHYYWMSGPPHEDLTIRTCYDDQGQPVNRKEIAR